MYTALHLSEGEKAAAKNMAAANALQ